MQFIDVLSSVQYLGQETGSTTPIALDSDTSAILTLAAGHNLTGTAMEMYLADFDLTGKTTGNDPDDVNGWFTATNVSTNAITFTLGSAANETGSAGGSKGVVTISRQNGVLLENGRKLVIKNCTFRGFNHEYALKLVRCKDVLIENCTFERCKGDAYNAAIRLEGCQDVQIVNCTMVDCHVGVRMEEVTTSGGGNGPNRDITIKGCTIEAIRGIHASEGSMDGYLKIDSNVITGNIYNTARPWIRYKTTGAKDAGIFPIHGVLLYCADVEITNNRIGNRLVMEGGSDFANTVFWGQGDGYTKMINGRNNDAIPTFRTPLFVQSAMSKYSVYKNRRGDSTTFEGGSAIITGNELVGWGYVCYIRPQHNSAVGSTSGSPQEYSGLIISNNNIGSGYYGIIVDPAQRYIEGGFRVSNVTISSNNVRTGNVILESPGYNRSSPAPYFQGRFGNIGNAGLYLGSHAYNNEPSALWRWGTIADNNIINCDPLDVIDSGTAADGSDDGGHATYGMLIGSSSTETIAFRYFTVSGNKTSTYGYGFYSPPASGGTNEVTFYRGIVKNNIFHRNYNAAMYGPVGDGFGGNVVDNLDA